MTYASGGLAAKSRPQPHDICPALFLASAVPVITGTFETSSVGPSVARRSVVGATKPVDERGFLFPHATRKQYTR